MTPTPSKRIKKENVPYTDTTLSDRKKKSPAKKKGKKKMLAITSSSSVVPAKKGGKVKVSLLTGKPVGKSKVRKEADIKVLYICTHKTANLTLTLLGCLN